MAGFLLLRLYTLPDTSQSDYCSDYSIGRGVFFVSVAIIIHPPFTINQTAGLFGFRIKSPRQSVALFVEDVNTFARANRIYTSED